MSETPVIDQDEILEVDEAPIRLGRHRVDDAEMDITPMIDITFLLLIFFLVASKMDQAATVKLPPARHGLPVASKNAVILLVKKQGDDGASVQRSDGTAFSSDLAEQEQQIAEYVEAGLAGQAPFEVPKEHVLIKAERDVKHRYVSQVAQAVAKGSEGQQLYIAVLEQVQ